MHIYTYTYIHMYIYKHIYSYTSALKKQMECKGIQRKSAQAFLDLGSRNKVLRREDDFALFRASQKCVRTKPVLLRTPLPQHIYTAKRYIHSCYIYTYMHIHVIYSRYIYIPIYIYVCTVAAPDSSSSAHIHSQ